MTSPPDPATSRAPGIARVVRLCVSLPLLAAAVAGVWPGALTWGASFLPFLPGSPSWLAVAWPLLILFLVWTPMSGRLGNLLTGRLEPAILGRPLIAFGLIPVLGMLAAWLLRARTPLLGDGVLLVNLLGDGVRHHGFDFMAYHLHARLAQFLGLSTAAQAQQMLAATSVLTGGLYLAAAAWSARVLVRRPGDGVLLFGLLVLAAPWQLFLGYAECYAQLAVCLLLAMVSLLREREGHGRLVTASLWYAAALFWHLNALFLAPLMLGVALAGGDGRTRWRRLATVGLPSLGALSVGALLLLTAGDPRTVLVDDFLAPQAGRRLLNALGGDRGLVDWRLWKDLLNLALLLVAVPLALLLSARVSGRRPATSSLAWGGVGIGVVALLLNMKLGVVRDWDLLAAHASVVTLAAFAASRAAALPAALIGVVWLASVGLNLPWFVVNAVPDAARSRLVAVTVDLPAYPRALALEDLGQQARDAGDLERSVEAYRMAAEACPLHARFHVLHGQAQFRRGEYRLAVGPLRHALSLDPDNLLTHRMLLMSLTRLQRPEAALPHARALAGTHQEDWQVARAHGALAEQVGTPDEAMEAYLRAWKLAPERTELAVRSGELGLVAGRVEWAEQVFRRVLARDPGHGQARLGLARSLWSQVVAVALPDLERLGEVDRLLTDVAVPEAEATQVASWRDDVRERLRLAAAGD